MSSAKAISSMLTNMLWLDSDIRARSGLEALRKIRLMVRFFETETCLSPLIPTKLSPRTLKPKPVRPNPAALNP